MLHAKPLFNSSEYAEKIEAFVQENYLKEKLHMLRSDKQLGLIKARMFGARHATGTIYKNIFCFV